MEQILIPVNEKIGELKRYIALLELPKRCPFYGMFGSSIQCPYKDNQHTCYNDNIAPGNGDAWCAKQINKSLTKSLIS